MRSTHYYSLLLGLCQWMIPFCLLCSFAYAQSSQSSQGCNLYEEADGLIVMEAEHTPSTLDIWVVKKEVSDFRGSGHLEFTGNGPNGGDPLSPLTYSFKVNTEGYYRLMIRARKRLEGQAPDKNNDGYVRVEGDFDEGSKVGDHHLDEARKETLMSDTKLFGGKAEEWGWAKQLDLGGHQNKRIPIYHFTSGETYTFTLSGRSVNWNVDQIVFFHESHTMEEVEGMKLEESVCSD